MLYTPAQIKTLALLATNYVVEEGEAHPTLAELHELDPLDDAPMWPRLREALAAYAKCEPSQLGRSGGAFSELQREVFDAYTEAFERQVEEGEKWLEHYGTPMAYGACGLRDFAASSFRMITNPSTRHRAEDWTQ